MVIRKSGRNHDARLTHAMEDYRLLAEQGDIVWRIYDGPIPDTNERSPGWIPSLWAASCLPWNVWAALEEMRPVDAAEAIRSNIRYLRVQQNNIKLKPTPDSHAIMAPPPEARPSSGRLVLAPRAERKMLGAVKKGEVRKEPETSMAARVRNVKSDLKNRSLNEIQYSSGGDTWFGNIRELPSGFELYAEDGDDPLLRVAKEALTVNTGSTVFAHEPSGLRFKTKQSNPLAETLPSTSAIPVDPYLPYLGEVMAIVALAKSVMEFFKKAGDESFGDFVSTTDQITEVIDYQTMQSWYEFNGDV